MGGYVDFSQRCNAGQFLGDRTVRSSSGRGICRLYDSPRVSPLVILGTVTMDLMEGIKRSDRL